MNEKAILQAQYERAVESFVEKVQVDKNILAVIVCGSLAYDRVWEKSDIDLTVLIRDQAITTAEYAVDEDGIVVNASIMTLTNFRRMMNRSNGASFTASFYAKGRLVYSVDETIGEILEESKTIGPSDIPLYLMWLSCDLIGGLHKAEKWLMVKNDPMYARLYILKSVETIAAMEVASHGEPPTREAIQRAEALNSDLIEEFYRLPMRQDMNGAQILKTIQKMYAYLDSCLPAATRPLLEYLSDGEMKTATMLSKYFNAYTPHFFTNLLEYIAEKGILVKTTQTIRITPKGRPVAEEIAYMYLAN